MAMDAEVLRDLVISKMASVTQVQKEGEGAISEREDFLLAFCEAVVEHIQASGLTTKNDGHTHGIT